MKLKKGDSVKILTGKDKGKVSTIEKVFPTQEKVLVHEVNQYKRHLKGRAQGQKSEIVLITRPLPVSNVALMCPKCKKATRVGYSITQNGKVRVCRKCEEAL